jgi:hypothetical protein
LNQESSMNVTPAPTDPQSVVPSQPANSATGQTDATSKTSASFADALKALQGTDGLGSLALLQALKGASGTSSLPEILQAVQTTSTGNTDLALLKALGSGANSVNVTNLLRAVQQANEAALLSMLQSSTDSSDSTGTSDPLGALFQPATADDSQSSVLGTPADSNSLFQDLTGAAGGSGSDALQSLLSGISSPDDLASALKTFVKSSADASSTDTAKALLAALANQASSGSV